MLYLPKLFTKDKRSSSVYRNTSYNEKFYNIDTWGLNYKTFYGLLMPWFHSKLLCLSKLVSGNTKGGSITILLTSCLTGLD